MKNQLNIDVNNSMIDILKELDRFQPDIIMAYPAIFQNLAYLKRKGYGKNIKAKLLWTGGAMLDDYTRKYVQNSFKCRMLNIYPSVEAGTDIAFECNHGTWHVNHDFFHVEAIDENNELVGSNKRGHIVLTKLWGTATPIIRYTGMDDWVELLDYYECKCGLKTPIIVNGVEGRKRANIILPNGKVFPPGAFCFITPVLLKYNTYKVKQYQIIQKKIDQIQILLVIDEDLKDKKPSFTILEDEIKKIYQEKTGPDVEITVTEVDEIKNKKNASKPPPVVLSQLKKEDYYKIFKTKN
jgi:phenylacetate-coenzyme A ligase PaaK-like adenylate-forming protein